MLRTVTRRPEWIFFATLPSAGRGLAAAWWAVLVTRSVLPAVLAVTTGWLVGAVRSGSGLAAPLVVTGIAFVALQALGPVQIAVSAALGDRLESALNDRLAPTTTAPPGLGHLEDRALADDLVAARDFDLGMTGPPLFVAMNFIANGVGDLVAGTAAAIVLAGFAWWAPLVLAGGWASTHWLLRESGVWKDRQTEEVRDARRDADYAYRLAVDPPAAKELRVFGLADWTLDRFLARRRRLHDLQYAATRMRERSVLVTLAVVLVANALVFWALGAAARDGDVGLGALVTYATAAIGVSSIAFGGLNWALDDGAAPVAAVGRLEEAMAARGSLPLASPAGPAAGMPAREVRFRGVTFAYPGASEPVLADFDLTVPAGSSLAIVGRNGAGKTTLAKLLCRFYDPTSGAIEVDGTDLRALDLAGWRRQVAAVFQDYTRYELPLRDNVAPGGAPDPDVLAALTEAGGASLASLETVLSRAYAGGTDLSGGQWQRVALARALCSVRLGAGLVLLDEPTAQLDIRGEAAIFDRILAATRDVTTILVSHRFSTVRHADRICVVEHGRVIELGSHDELMALGGRYREMFDLQARPFAVVEGEEEAVLDVL